MISSDVLSLFW